MKEPARRIEKPFSSGSRVTRAALLGCLGLAAGLPVGCRSRPAPFRAPRVHAVLFTGSDWRAGEPDLEDPRGLNATWIQTARICRALQRRGAHGDAIHVLYLDGKPPLADPAVGPVRGALSKPRPSEWVALVRLLRAIRRRFGPEDQLVLHLSAHGEPCGQLETDPGETITARALVAALRPFPPRQVLLVVDACFAEAFLDRAMVPGAIGTARADEYGWVERDFSFGEFFFAELALPFSGDGVDRAFRLAANRYRAAGESRLPYIRQRYAGVGLCPEKLNRLRFVAVRWEPPRR